jgi:hypothetical protein
VQQGTAAVARQGGSSAGRQHTHAALEAAAQWLQGGARGPVPVDMREFSTGAHLASLVN